MAQAGDGASQQAPASEYVTPARAGDVAPATAGGEPAAPDSAGVKPLAMEIEIGGKAALENSPIGAHTVNYHFSDRAADEDPTLPVELDDIELGGVPSPVDVEPLVTRLLATRMLFVLFEPAGAESFDSLRSHLLHALGSRGHALRTTRETRPLDFQELQRRPSRYSYDTPTVLCLSRNSIRQNLDYLKRSDLRMPLQRRLTVASACLIVPVPRNELPADYEALARLKADHVCTIEAPPAASAPAPHTEAVEWGENALFDTVRFVVGFFPGLPQREIGSLVAALLRDQQPAAARTEPRRGQLPRRFSAPVSPDLQAQWSQSQDRILHDCGVVFQRNASAAGSYVFRDPAVEAQVRTLVLERSRRWVADRLEAVLDTLFSAPAASHALEQGCFELMLQLHEQQIVEIDAPAIWKLLSERLLPQVNEALFMRFERLVHHLLRSPVCRDSAVRFLKELPQHCRENTDTWLHTLFQIDAVRYCMSSAAASPAERDAALHLARRAIDALDPGALAPLRSLNVMLALIIGAMSAEPASTIVPILLEAISETPEQRSASAPSAGTRLLNVFTRPAAWGSFFGLRAYLGQSCDLLNEFASAVLAAREAAGEPVDTATGEALTVLLDALHQSVDDVARRYLRQGDDDAKAFFEYFFDGQQVRDFSAVLAQSNLLRSPPREWTLVADRPPLRSSDLAATARLYQNIALALHHIEGGTTAGLRLRYRALIAPLLERKGLSAAQRVELRQLLRDAETYYRWQKEKHERAGERELARATLVNIDVVRWLLAALP